MLPDTWQRVLIGRYRPTPNADPEDHWYFYKKDSKTNEIKSMLYRRALGEQNAGEAVLWKVIEDTMLEQPTKIEPESLLSESDIVKKWFDFNTPCSDYVTSRMAVLLSQYKNEDLNELPSAELLNEMRAYGKACVSPDDLDAVFEYKGWKDWSVEQTRWYYEAIALSHVE
ncbi:hypothetical protein E8E13_010827 [Curvularia kusanoi]|uniref:Uncharacterized protein n=1 Tax=Curvularia kusanoi TaxID=90978 RepID=A0A9P4TL09_CURKU|nr:hypothetical protein E8E13_010827 [Curvularia kusanoi]